MSMHAPKLRFKGFSDDWEKKKIGEITLKVGSGSTPRGGEKVYQSNGIPFIRSQNVNNNFLNLKDLTFITDAIHKQMQGSTVKANDILLNITGASIGRSCVVPDNFKEGNVNQHVCIIRLKSGFLSRFIQPFLSSTRGQKLVLSYQVGSGREGLNFQAVRSFNIDIPSFPEQTKIATFLTAIDEKITQLTQKHDLLKQYKKGVMQQIFSQKLRFKDDDGREFPEWEESIIGDVISQKPKKFNPDKSDINFKCVELEHLSQTTGELLGHTDSRKQKSIKNKFKNGDVLFGKLRPYLKKFLKAPFDGVCSTEIWVLSGVKVSNDFLYQLVQTHDFISLANISSGSKMPRADWNIVAAGVIRYPVLEEQTKIANCLTAIDDKITQTQAQLEAVKQYKKGLLQQMFV